MRLLPAVLIALFMAGLPLHTFAMVRPVFSAITTTMVSTTTQYYKYDSGYSATVYSVSTSADTPTPIGGTVSSTSMQVSVAPGAGTSWTITLLKNGVASAVTCTISDSNTSCGDYFHTVTLLPGDTISWMLVPTNSPNATGTFSLVSAFEGTTPGETMLMGGCKPTTISAYCSVPMLIDTPAATLQAVEVIAPTDFTISKLNLLSSAMVSGDSYTVTLYKNGSATPLSVTVNASANGVGVKDLGNSVSVSAGDTLGMFISASSTVSTYVFKWSVKITPTIDGEFPIMTKISALSTLTRFTALRAGGSNNAGNINNETLIRVPSPVAFMWRKLYVLVDPAVTGTQQWSMRNRINGVSGNLAVNITNSNVGSDTTRSDPVSVGDLVDYLSIGFNTPSVGTRALFSSVSYIPPVIVPTFTVSKYKIIGGFLRLVGGALRVQ